MPSAVQRLLDACREVFADGDAGIVPSLEDVDRIMSIFIHGIDASDVGLTPDVSYFHPGERRILVPRKVIYILDGSTVQIVIFCLPPSGVIPLHDHPGMTGYSASFSSAQCTSNPMTGPMHLRTWPIWSTLCNLDHLDCAWRK
ncbi:hypothetical protein B296_00059161 [Ensete ventricosum]|uniref:cysteine dioxygenase n=1 Tax=Ensete ventricosum TaxID=4639 RepID=A0A426XJ03_ENSVE|nr:hypothetical protein B296_00059161 [Ensete ventricosum]